MSSGSLLGIGVVLLLVAAACAYARRTAVPVWRRNALSVTIVVVGLVSAFFMFFGAGTLMREMRAAAPTPHGHLLRPEDHTRRSGFAAAAGALAAWPLRAFHDARARACTARNAA
jgi:hypothetical protein